MKKETILKVLMVIALILRYKAGILGYSIAEMKALQIVLNKVKRVAAGTFVCYNGDT